MRLRAQASIQVRARLFANVYLSLPLSLPVSPSSPPSLLPSRSPHEAIWPLISTTLRAKDIDSFQVPRDFRPCLRATLRLPRTRVLPTFDQEPARHRHIYSSTHHRIYSSTYLRQIDIYPKLRHRQTLSSFSVDLVRASAAAAVLMPVSCVLSVGGFVAKLQAHACLAESG